MTLAVECDKSPLLNNTRIKISEWLDSRRVGSNTTITIYFEFSDPERMHELDHIYLLIPKDDFKHINFPNIDEIRKENEILKKPELAQKIDIKGRYIQPIFIKNISSRVIGKYTLIRIDFEEFKADGRNSRKCQFHLYVRESFKKESRPSIQFIGPPNWTYEARIHPLVIDKRDYPDIVQIKMDLELWVMVEPTMYSSISDLIIRSTKPYDRFVVLPDDTAKIYERDFVSPKALCIRWLFPEFSESGLDHKIFIDKRRSAMEKEKMYVKTINTDENNFFSIINQILGDSMITCIDFEYITNKIDKKQKFSKFLEILFELTYHRDDDALERLDEFVNILEELQNLKYGKYYLQLYKLINQMRSCESVGEIIAPYIKKNAEKLVNESEFINKATIEFFKELGVLIDLIEQFNYYTIPEEKYSRKMDILQKIAKLREIAERKLINPESYLLAEQVLIKWERLVEDEFEQFVGTPRLAVELKTQKLLYSKDVYLIFDVKNTGEIPLFSIEARLLSSEQYDVSEQEKAGTRKRERLTKSNPQNERIFSPEFVVCPKVTPYINVQLEIKFVTEDGKKYKKVFDGKVEFVPEDTPFREIEQNPYIVGNPIKTEDMFYGREDAFKKICRTIDSPLINQTIIYGQYRIGKTSLLYQLLNKLKERYVPVLAYTHGLEAGDSELLAFWSSLISNAVKNRGTSVPERTAYEGLPNPCNGFQKFIEGTTERLGGVKIIFMIDEYDLIDDLVQDKEIGKEIFKLLDWMIKHDKIELIMAGRLSMENLKSEEWSEIARPFGQVKLGPLDRENAEKLIREPVRGFLEYDDSAIEKIIKLTNCHPYLLQVCCHVLVNYHNLEKKSTLTYADVERCIPEMTELGTHGLEAMILKDTSSHEKILLEVMADVLEDRSSISERELVVKIRERNQNIEDRDIKNAILDLKEREVIRSTTEKTEEFKFICELFQYWTKVRRNRMGITT